MRLAAVSVAVAGWLLLLAGPAAAHPLGELSVNHASALRVSPDGVRVLFVVDLAEVPSVPALSTIDSQGRQRYGTTRCAGYADRLELRLDGDRVRFEVVGSTVFVLPGDAGLRIVRVECRLSTPDGTVTVGRRLDYADRADTERVGWREVTATGDRTRLVGSTVPAHSESETLARYPDGEPVRVSTASFDVRAGGAPVPEVTSAGPPPGGDDYADLPAVLGVLLAAALGAGHALTPGHGKTLMALYLTGTRGSLRDAVVVGASVTATHTVGVFVLAALVSVSALTAPDTLYPWLGLGHGALIAVIGVALLVRARRKGHGHGHGHGHERGPDHEPEREHGAGHEHEHGHVHEHERGHSHEHEHQRGQGHWQEHGTEHSHCNDNEHRRGRGHGHWHRHERGRGRGRGRFTGLVGFGIAGGLVPSPSALLVLLGAQATGRSAYGIVFVLAYGVGMAGCLSSVGWLLSRGGARLAGAGGRLGWVGRNLPVLAPTVIVCSGVFLAVRSIPQLSG